jgi:hypothetical protein
MRSKFAIAAATAALVFAVTAAVAGPAFAASPHFKPHDPATCTFSGTTSISVSCTGVLAGLGNADVQIDLSVSGSALYECQNPGGNLVPGQNKVLEGPATSTTSIPASEIKNGNLSFTTNPAVLTAAPTVPAAVAGCPNDNWLGVNPTLTLTSIELVISQPPGTVIFDCTASDPNGLTSPVVLAC